MCFKFRICESCEITKKCKQENKVSIAFGKETGKFCLDHNWGISYVKVKIIRDVNNRKYEDCRYEIYRKDLLKLLFDNCYCNEKLTEVNTSRLIT